MIESWLMELGSWPMTVEQLGFWRVTLLTTAPFEEKEMYTELRLKKMFFKTKSSNRVYTARR